uniref:NDP-1-glucose synthase n=1 Tax=Streptomyces sp. MJ635-86F5 TaxID=1321967 RepID=X5IJA0_9ACTN|nr:NDP-1-glucose synthase [Streptomyces sp. MJ635-86F5]
MKALVLAGGTGVRLRPFSHSMPKQLFPVANKPVLGHVLDNIAAAGITEVGIVVGDWEEDIRAVLGNGSRHGLRIEYIRQDQPLGLAHCVRIARDFLGSSDFVMYLGDNILPDGIRPVAEQFRAERPAAQLVMYKVPDPRAFGVVELHPDGSVAALVEKPQDPRSNLALIGVYFFTSRIHEAVDAIAPSARGELEITDAVQWLLASGADVRASEYEGYWKDTGRIEDLLECNRRLLAGLAGRVAGAVDEESVLVGPVVVEEGARVVRSRIEGPAIIGSGTTVEDCRIGAHSAIGRDCVLRRSGIDHSITLDGATVTDVPNLHGSLIGRSAVVGAEPGNTGHRLIIGDDARVEVAA